jgi:hypothetical protein
MAPPNNLPYTLDLLDDREHSRFCSEYANKFRSRLFPDEVGAISQFMRSATDHNTHVSICKKCYVTVADLPSRRELVSKERWHLC